MENKNIGRPAKFTSPEEVQKLGDEYFAVTPEQKISITGLCLHLGVVRNTLLEYEKMPDFSDTIKMLKLRVEHAYEVRGIEGTAAPAFVIFALKNFSWKDKFEQEFNVASTLTFADILAKIDGKDRGKLPCHNSSTGREKNTNQPVAQ